MIIPRKSFVPAYIKTWEEGKFDEKIEKALKLLEKPCGVCPRGCKVSRKDDEFGVCMIGRYAVVSSAFPHFGEEDCLRGWAGSGTIFFSGCNLKCVFCQNWDISQVVRGKKVTPEELADIMLWLQDQGCHNINFVTPEHVVPQIVEALPIAIRKGLRLPIVYNTSAYDSPKSLEIMDGIVDIYMPDFKFWERESARRYLKAPDYPDVAKHSIKQMHKQVGDLIFDENGLALRGVLLRHLVMPGHVEESKKILEWIARELSPNTYINIMAQYRPEHKAHKYPEIARKPYFEEYMEVVRYAIQIGLRRIDRRSVESAYIVRENQSI